MVGYGKFNNNEFIRFITVNGGNEKEDIETFFKKLETFADANF
jgi:sulfinoalanine decarboxylase